MLLLFKEHGGIIYSMCLLLKGILKHRLYICCLRKYERKDHLLLKGTWTETPLLLKRTWNETPLLFKEHGRNQLLKGTWNETPFFLKGRKHNCCLKEHGRKQLFKETWKETIIV